MPNTENHIKSRSPLREVIVFCAVAFSLAVAATVAFPDDEFLNTLLCTVGPAITIAILTFTMFRRGTRRDLWRNLGLGKTGVRVWGWAFGLPLLLCGGAFGTALLVGAGHLRPLVITGSTAGSFAIDAVLAFMIYLPLLMCEEIGFRGFLLPRLQQLTSKRRAALVTGFVHGLYHLPLLLIATTYDAVGPRWVAVPMAILVISAAGVFYAWLWDRTGSLWACGIGHTVANMTFSFGLAAVASTTSVSLALVAGETGFATLGVVVIAAVVLLMRAKVWRTPETTTADEVRQPVAVR